ncbi:MAG: hypothetical protein JJ992_09790, partial [Planctomycetes bacterium]|nr:hypothetical protein [Planctomycetota bacterium]
MKPSPFSSLAFRLGLDRADLLLPAFTAAEAHGHTSRSSKIIFAWKGQTVKTGENPARPIPVAGFGL